MRGFSRYVPSAPEHRARLTELGQSAWVSHDGLRVVTSLVNAELPGSGEPPLVGPTWHVSVSRSSTPEARCTVTDVDLLRVVDGFEMPAFDEDNHHPGQARHLFCPVEEQYRNACECKVDEGLVVEPSGYRWSTKADECRGCEFERLTGLPCTVHHVA